MEKKTKILIGVIAVLLVAAVALGLRNMFSGGGPTPDTSPEVQQALKDAAANTEPPPVVTQPSPFTKMPRPVQR